VADLIEERRAQMFPVLTPVQMEVVRRFASGEPQTFEPGAPMFLIGQVNAPIWFVLKGSIRATRRDGLGRGGLIAYEMPGQFSGEVNQLSGRAVLADGHAGPEGCTALPFDSAHVRALLVGSAEIGEIVMRAFILRRMALLQSDSGAGSILIGDAGSPWLVRLQGFLSRNGYPVQVLDARRDAAALELIDRLHVPDDELPLMLCPNGTVLRRPTDAEAAMCLGLTPALDSDSIYDVAVVGAGPAGLATSVYAASEGLRVLLLDSRAIGGQAGASARIENYLGFPTGISGQALAGRAYNQALKFGVEVAIPIHVLKVECPEPSEVARLHLDNGQTIQARTVVIASGARYRRPDIEDMDRFECGAISYWASPIEAKLCEGREVALVGGGNSAGQAVAFLAAKVKHLHLIVRRPLEATMSRYLIDRIAALPNVTVHMRSEVVRMHGSPGVGLERVTVRDRDSGAETSLEACRLFLFIGADPNTDWLNGCVKLDDHGFVVTGGHHVQGAACDLETSKRRIFAVGDARCGSTKRVAAAVGEGAAVVAQIHALLEASA
jgi:thioredoxin reductase (NADPH)